MFNQCLMVSMVLWQVGSAFIIQDQKFAIDIANLTSSVFGNVSIAADPASAIVIDDEQPVPSIENQTKADEIDQKKPDVKPIPTSFVQIEQIFEIFPDDDDVKSTVKYNNNEEKASRDSSNEEHDKPRHEKYSNPDEEHEPDDPEDEDDDD